MDEHMSYSKAIEKAESGFLVARAHWLDAGAFVFQATGGSFTAYDKTTGQLTPFLVAYMRGAHVPYFASPEDREATDWVSTTRQEADRHLREIQQKS